MAQAVAHLIGSEEVTGPSPVISSQSKIPINAEWRIYRDFLSAKFLAVSMYKNSFFSYPNPEVIKMIDSRELPMGFTMALAQHTEKLKQFARLSDEEQNKIVEEARQTKSRKEMREYVQNLFTDSAQ